MYKKLWIMMTLFLVGCGDECRPGRPWYFYDTCPDALERGRPAPCPWKLMDGRCEPPVKRKR